MSNMFAHRCERRSKRRYGYSTRMRNLPVLFYDILFIFLFLFPLNARGVFRTVLENPRGVVMYWNPRDVLETHVGW